MAENINLDVDAVLSVIAGLRDRNPEAAKNTIDTLKLILNREGFLPGDVTEAIKPLTDQVSALIASQQSITTTIGELMATFEEVKAGIEANTAQAAKAQLEIRAKIDELIARQADVDAA